MSNDDGKIEKIGSTENIMSKFGLDESKFPPEERAKLSQSLEALLEIAQEYFNDDSYWKK